jgi:hypothetical protein
MGRKIQRTDQDPTSVIVNTLQKHFIVPDLKMDPVHRFFMAVEKNFRNVPT